MITVEGGEIQEVPCYQYLGDLIERSGSAERAVRSRVAFGWSKWRELRGVLGNRSIPLPFRARVYNSCVRPAILYGAETWALTRKLEDVLQKCDRRMLRYMAGVSLRDGVSSEEVLRRCKLGDIVKILRSRRLKWFGHVARREEESPLKCVEAIVVPGRVPPGRPRKTWKDCVAEDLQMLGVTEDSARDREEWNGIINRLTSTQGTQRR